MANKDATRKATEEDLWKILRRAADKYKVTQRSELAALTLALRVIADRAPDLVDHELVSKRSRSSKWDFQTSGSLVLEVRAEIEKLKAHGSASDVSAVCRALAKREPWSTLCRSSKRQAKWQVLREKYVRLTAGWDEMEAARKRGDGTAFLELWEKHVQRGEFAYVDVYANDFGEQKVIPRRAENKSPKLPFIDEMRARIK